MSSGKVSLKSLMNSLSSPKFVKYLGMFLLCLSVLTACAGTPRPAKTFMTDIPLLNAGPVIKADLQTIEIATLKWLEVCFGCNSVDEMTKIPPIFQDDLDLIRTSVFDQKSTHKLSLIIEKLHLKSDVTVVEMVTGEVSADADATYVLKRADGTEILREDIQSKGTATFSDSIAHVGRKSYAQRYAAFSNFDAFRQLLVAKSKEINDKLK